MSMMTEEQCSGPVLPPGQTRRSSILATRWAWQQTGSKPPANSATNYTAHDSAKRNSKSAKRRQSGCDGAEPSEST